jgi:hypothetical protein
LTDTKNVAVERDFYRLTDLNKGDTEFVRALAFSHATRPTLRDLNERWISMFETFVALQRAARTHPNADAAALATLDRAMIEYQENAYMRMEDAAIEPLTALQAGDVEFFNDDERAASFSYFLAHQYLRTKAVRDRIQKTWLQADETDRFDRTWPIFRYVFATNLGYSIFAHRHAMRLQILHAPAPMEFITADQPAINTYGAFVQPDPLSENFELYYPLSPTRALIISGHAVYKHSHGTTIDPFRLNYLNQAMEFAAHEQLFSKSQAPLQSIARAFCKPPLPTSI